MTKVAHRIAILVVEDEVLVRMDIVDLLAREGFEVLEAGNAAQAIHILDANPTIRLIFTDVDMPGTMDGLALAAAVRDRWPAIKIIVTSGHRLVGNADMPDGSVFYGKPYTHLAVLASMREMLLA